MIQNKLHTALIIRASRHDRVNSAHQYPIKSRLISEVYLLTACHTLANSIFIFMQFVVSSYHWMYVLRLSPLLMTTTNNNVAILAFFVGLFTPVFLKVVQHRFPQLSSFLFLWNFHKWSFALSANWTVKVIVKLSSLISSGCLYLVHHFGLNLMNPVCFLNRELIAPSWTV